MIGNFDFHTFTKCFPDKPHAYKYQLHRHNTEEEYSGNTFHFHFVCPQTPLTLPLMRAPCRHLILPPLQVVLAPEAAAATLLLLALARLTIVPVTMNVI